MEVKILKKLLWANEWVSELGTKNRAESASAAHYAVREWLSTLPNGNSSPKRIILDAGQAADFLKNFFWTIRNNQTNLKFDSCNTKNRMVFQ